MHVKLNAIPSKMLLSTVMHSVSIPISRDDVELPTQVSVHAVLARYYLDTQDILTLLLRENSACAVCQKAMV